MYVWHDRAGQRVVTSGVQLRDLLPMLSRRGGVYLLRHGLDRREHDEHEGLTVVTAERLPALASEDVYGWGDALWIDYPPGPAPTLPPESLAEVLYFGHTGTPLRGVGIPALGNHFLACGHDDGWRLVLYYADWAPVEELLAALIAPPVWDTIAGELRTGQSAFWIEQGTAAREQATMDIDAIMNARPRPRR